MNWKKISLILSLAALGIGALAFAGWVFDIDALQRIHPEWVTMKVNTALCLMLGGAALALSLEEGRDGRQRWLAQGCALILVAVGVVTLAEYLFAWDAGIDQALFRESLAEAGRSFPGRMGPASALVFVLLGMGVLLLDVRTARGIWPAQFCAAAAAALTSVIFLGYFYNVDLPPKVAPYVSIALHTVVAFLLLCAALLLARPDHGFAAIFFADNTGGLLARRILPTALLVPSLLGWLFILARQAGYYGVGVAVALLAESVTVIFAALVWWVAQALERADAHRRRTEAEMLAARDAAEAANRAKDEFLAALSHELRTPLTPVLMLAGDREKAAELPRAVRADFAMIRKNVELEARIIDDLLDLTRITRGKLTLRMESVDVHLLVEHGLTILRSDAAAKQLGITVALGAARHHVRGDGVRLQQVCWNILKNAIKFTPPGGRIAIRSWNEGGHLRVATTDTGLGITPGEMPGIFTAFSQGREAAQPRFGGLGLGLSITALLVGEHGGRIWAESPGRDLGTTFHLALPLAPEPATAPAGALDAQPARVRSWRILLVEDHDDTRAVLQRLMTRWGHRVTTAATVAEARAAILAGSFDLLLSDVGLPDGTGHEVIAALRAKSDIPAVSMSGYGMEADLARAEAAGFARNLVKPVSAEVLRELLSHFPAL